MRKILNLLFGLSFLFSASVLNAQVCGYTFSQTSGTYTEISGGTYVFGNASGTGGWDDGISQDLPIGFTINFAGTNFDRFSLNPNGYIVMGPTIVYDLYNILCSGRGSGRNNVISALTTDLHSNNNCSSGGAGSVQYLTTGTAPNRVLTVQWKNIGLFANASLCMNFQIKLYETTNKVEIVYGSFDLSASTTRNFQVGIAGSSECDFLVREVTSSGSWAASTSGLTACGNCFASSTIKPASGLTYTFDYGTATCASCCPPSNTTSSNVTGGTATISWTASNSNPSNGYEYEVRTSGAGGSGSTGLVASGSVGAGVTSVNISGLTPATTYTVYVRANCGSGNYSIYPGGATFTTTSCNSAGTLSGTNAVCVAGTTQLTSSGTTGGTWSTSASGVATVSSSGLVTGVAAGTATITYTIAASGTCSESTATRSVTVTAASNPGTLSGNQSVFIGGTSTFASTVTGGIWSSSNTAVATINASTGVITSVATGNATITYTVAGTGGCSDASATRTLTVYTCPTIAALSPSVDRVCAGTNITLTAAGLTGVSSSSSGITFKYSTSTLADPYVGGTVIATVSNANLEASGSIARTTTSFSTGGTYYIYAILSPVPGGTGCLPYATTTVVVNPNGQVTLPANSIVCSGTSIAAQTLTTTNSGGTTTYAWTNSATSIGLAASGSTATIPAFTATNTGAASVTATISVTPTYTDGGLSCIGAASSYTITVNPIPSLTTVTDRIVCSGSSNTISLTGPVTGTVYNWTNSNTAIGLGASGTGNISFTATNAGPDPISGTVTVTPSYTNAGLTCTGSASSFTVTVNPNGQVNTVSNQVLCNGSATSTVTFTTTNNGLISTGGTQTASSGTISVSVPDASAVGATATIPVTLPTGAVINNMRVTLNLTHTWISDMVINLKAPNGQILNLFNQHGGSGDNLVNTVVSSTGTTAFSSGSAPFTGTFAATAASGQGPTGNVSNAANFAALYSTPNGNWSLALRDLFGGDVGVLTSWSISIDYTVQGTFGTNMNWTNSTTSIGLGASGTGNIPSFTAVNNGSAPVTSTVTVTPVYFNSGVSCPGTPTTFTYTVNPTPTVNAVVSPVFCAGTPSTVNFSGNATGTVYSWTNSNTAIGLAASGTGSLSFTPTNSGTTPIIATITVTPSFTNGGVTCTGTPRTFTITVNPVGQVNAVNSQVLCNGANTTAVNFATVNGGGTIVAGTPVVTNSGTISILVPDANAGGASHTIPVTLPAGATVTGVSVNFNMNHTWVSDMVFNLKAPNGQILNLVNRRGGAGVNFTNTNISSAGTASLATGAAPFTGTFAADAAIGVGPTGQLSSAANYAALYSVGSGDWTLQMRDYVGGDVGTLTSWSITINYTTLVPAVTSYAWTNNLSSIGLAASGTGNIASFAATNTTAAPVTATVTVTPTYTNAGVGCAGTPISYTYTVNPTPTVNAVSNQTVCVGSNVAAVNYTGATTGTVYNWTNSNTAIGLAASGTGNIASFVGTNTTAAPISGTITVTPVYTNAGVTCTGIPRTFTITVNPIPTVNPVASFAACHNTTAAAAFSGATTGTVFNWTNSNPAIGLPASGSGNISFTALNTTSAPVTATITVTPSFTNGGTTCVGTPTSFVITVNPLPVVTTGALPGRICISDTLVRLNGTPVGGSWSGFGISGFNFMPPATDVGAWPITYTYADANGCVNRATTNVTVLACEERNRDLDNGAVILYPNPNSGQFNLRVNSTRFNVLGMKVYNTSGQLVYTNQWRGLVFARVIPVNLNNLAAGNYMIRLYYGDGMDRGADKTYQVIIAR
jgi:subtilisin-like proprotein convertase family protein